MKDRCTKGRSTGGLVFNTVLNILIRRELKRGRGTPAAAAVYVLKPKPIY